jgi:two-component system, NarL family, sensor kinase
MVEDLLSGEGQIVNIILGAILLLIIMAMALIAFFYLSRKRITESELANANLQIAMQQEVLQSTLITQENERKRIAQDLHDAISSKLNVVSLQANLLKDDTLSEQETKEIGGHILKITTTVLESSRQIAHALLPPTLDKFGLEAALEELYEELNGLHVFTIEDTYELTIQLNKEVELHIFRIVQELSNNAIKYSNATKLSFILTESENSILFEYSDDGVGMDVEQALFAKGIGMSGIQNRVAILEGVVQFESTPEKGLDVSIKIPKPTVEI